MVSKKVLIVGVIAALAFLLLFQNNFLLNINKPLAKGDDINVVYFVMQNDLEKITSFNFKQLFETRMFYPYRTTLAFGNSDLGQALLGLPVYLITKNIFTVTHSVILLNFFLGYLASYALAYKLTRSVKGALLAGLIYTYNPFITDHMSVVEVTTHQWIPMIFLLTEKMFEKVRWRYSSLLAILYLWQLISFVYYALFLIIVMPFYILIKLYITKTPVKKFISPAALVPFIIILIVSFFYMQPYQKVKKTYKFTRTLDYVESHSAKPLDFFSVSPNNIFSYPILKPILDPISPSYADTEHNLSPGFIADFFFIMGAVIFLEKKFARKEIKIVAPYMIIMLIGIVFALGPYLEIGNIAIPLPYALLYKFMPFIDSLRVPSRLMIIPLLSIAIIVALIWSAYIAKRLNKSQATIFFTVIILLICLEYWFTPLQPNNINQSVRSFYVWLDGRKDVRVIAELPLTYDFDGTSHYENADTDYLLYGTLHQKEIFNGTNSFMPDAYRRRRMSLDVNFPTPEKINYLKKLGVNLIVLHLDEYQKPQDASTDIEQMQALGVTQVYSSDVIAAYKI